MSELAELITALNGFVSKLTEQKKSTAPLDTLVSTNVKFEVFDENNESFDCYVQRLENFFKLKGLTQDNDETKEAKVLILINCIGAKNFQLLSSLTAPDAPSSKTYTELMELLKQHLSPKPNILTEQHKFLSRTQRQGESLTVYITALKELTKNANFISNCENDDCTKNLLNLILRAQFIRGLSDSDIREKILQQGEITFEKSVELALAIESAKLENVQVYKSFTPNQTVNKISFRKPSTSQHRFRSNSINRYHQRSESRSPNGRKNVDFKALGLDGLCIRCASKKHISKQCTATHLFCTNCKKSGHVISVCLSKLLGKKNTGNKQNKIHQIYNEEFQEMTINRVLETNSSFNSNDDRFLLLVNIDGKQVEFECDSGSRSSIMSIQQFHKLRLDYPIKKSNVIFRSYTGSSFKPIGVVKVHACYNGNSSIVDLYLVDLQKQAILGRDWIRNLKINLHEISKFTDVKQIPVFNVNNSISTIMNTYSDVFEQKVGQIPNYKCSLKLRHDAKPVFFKPRPVPYALREQVEKELDKLEFEGLIEKVDHSEWGTPLVTVPKPDGTIRICADYKVTVNIQLHDARHPIPRIEDIFNKLRNGSYFCTLDIYKAYLHLPVDDESSKIQTISTHRGTYLVKRLFFGIKSAPNEFHSFIDQFVQDLDGTIAYFDDIIVQGRTYEECQKRVIKVLDKLRRYNMHLNINKCKFFEQKVEYLGHVISSQGLQKSPAKVKAIIDAPRPQNVDQVRQFLGMVMYYSKFIENASTILYPLNRLLRKNITFKWTTECEHAFILAKTQIAGDQILVPFNPDLPVILATDASPYGLSGILSHKMDDGNERPIAFASRSLTAAERNYSQLDKEATAVYWSCKKFYDYIYGRKFTLVVDNKPLNTLLHPHKKLPVLTATRMLRYAQFLSNFDYDIHHRKSIEHANADYLSRNPLPLTNYEVHIVDNEYLYQEMVIKHITNGTVTDKEVRDETSKDTELSKLKEDVLNGKICDPEISLQEGILFRGHRVIIPEKLRPFILQELHSTHVGIVKMKALARNYCYWRHIDSDIENMVKSCKECCDVKKNPGKAPTHHWEAPIRNWQRVHMDYAGPFMGHNFLILVDARSKWPEIYAMKKSPTTSNTIHYLREIFSRHGLPEILVSDNAAIFKSADFKEFCQRNGINQRFIAPGHPATNGQAERYVHTLKTKLKCMQFHPGTLHEKLCELLFRYRSTPLSNGQTPAEIMLGHNLRTKLDLIKPQLSGTYRNVVQPEFSRFYRVGERVQSRNYTSSTLWKYGTVVERLGRVHYLVELDDGYVIKRHFDQLRSCQVQKQIKPAVWDYIIPQRKHVTFKDPPVEKEDSSMQTDRQENCSDPSQSNEESTAPDPVQLPASTSTKKANAVIELRRSKRIRKPVNRLNL